MQGYFSPVVNLQLSYDDSMVVLDALNKYINTHTDTLMSLYEIEIANDIIKRLSGKVVDDGECETD